MIKFVIAPTSLTKLLNQALPTKALPACPIKFTPLSTQINFLDPSGKFAIIANYAKDSYFKYYEAEDDYFVVINKMITALGIGFGNSKTLTFWTDAQFTHIDGEGLDDKLSWHIIPVKDEVKESPFDSFMTDKGLMPTLNGKVTSPDIYVSIDAERLYSTFAKSASYGNRIIFNWDGEELKMIAKHKKGETVRILTPNSFRFRGDPINAYFTRNIVQDLAKQFSGEVWLGIGGNEIVREIVEATGLSQPTVNKYLDDKYKVSTDKDRVRKPEISATERIENKFGKEMVERVQQEIIQKHEEEDSTIFKVKDTDEDSEEEKWEESGRINAHPLERTLKERQRNLEEKRNEIINQLPDEAERKALADEVKQQPYLTNEQLQERVFQIKCSKLGQPKPAISKMFEAKGEGVVDYICKPLERFSNVDISALNDLNDDQKTKVLAVLLESQNKISEWIKAINEYKETQTKSN
ncbi:MAG: hypothetical protein A2W22_03305 [Candidatus Levybacteria bacterium RBG_16_35_11]|nr:MAG: hypothetical protein A2W22_03305 [Candidatus Levybacteria bacterium RBG_16_35_11]